jgi:transcriptional regulator with XRE-family HTH domain
LVATIKAIRTHRKMRSKPPVSVHEHSAKRGLQLMDERSKTISRLSSDLDSRISYIKAKLNVIVPSEIRALRLKSGMPRQADLATAAKMHQSRISMFETPGSTNFTLETLAKLAAVFKVGLIVDFVPFSEMLDWENRFSQDSFDVVRIDKDWSFIEGIPRQKRRMRRKSRVLATRRDLSSPQPAVGNSGAQIVMPFAQPITPRVISISSGQTESGRNANTITNLLQRAGGR